MDLWVIDLDETLMRARPAYHLARMKAVNLMRNTWGSRAPNRESVLMYAQALDHVLHGTLDPRTAKLFTQRARFPFSLQETYVDLCGRLEVDVQMDVYRHLIQIGDRVFNKDRYPGAIHPDASRVTCRLVDEGHRVVILTKGDQDVQQEKIDALRRSGVAFHETHIVENDKRPALQKILAAFCADHVSEGTAHSVGDNFENEIRPALDLGYRAVWIAVKNGVTDHQREQHWHEARTRGVRVIGDIGQLL